MSPHLRTAFTGYYGMCNFGDDLFGVLCAAAARRYWNADPRLIGPPLAGVDADATWPLPRALYGSGGAIGKAARLLGFARGLRGTDVLVMGGGSVINARESFRQPMMLSAQARGRLQLAAVGVSIGPFADAASEEAAARFARHFAYLSVRDHRSFELAQRMGLERIVHRGRDLAGLLPMVSAPLPAATDDDRSVPRIGLAPCCYSVRADHPAPTPERWHEDCANALARMAARTPLQVDVFSLNGHPVHGDAALARDLHARLRASGIPVRVRQYAGGDPMAMVQAIRGCDAFISARLHGAIVAYVCSIPFAIVDYHPKCRDFADDVGLAAHLRIDERSNGEETFTQVLDALLNDRACRPLLSPDVYAREAQDIFQCAPWSNIPDFATRAA
ncbi:polysaccharide pyruvyl transferase family protein [Lysobacter sp. LF1]|uniref:Polysaccharide pyruvyl transferase family protein n=1 Tax=Lysobacter stagni TaxID=3045172 RepID=A0ABT6XJB9_9GAMM|nr:polysaccharide pyruvyl transferase family protein [Lysobacter sp. LF1]MDI9240255.1 polysaccharide pyruvyl transferase family protein [Lysobacter sp. LF1]